MSDYMVVAALLLLILFLLALLLLPSLIFLPSTFFSSSTTELMLKSLFLGNSVPRGYNHLVYCQYNGEACSFVNFTELDSMFTDKVYDGINVFVHNPRTFPTYEISHMPTSFPLRYGQIAHIEISGLQYTSDMSGRKACIKSKNPYRLVNFNPIIPV
ncbi:unnamed protein product [Schistocephalus solidus]|uniref:DUF5727 domain-containing protein n=1 Tax=Schistocephalus solidus TaxID=70667 RepID=A0A183SFY2_SCHSO|nr:unnamed protein product [Schistocephalus solidus]